MKNLILKTISKFEVVHDSYRVVNNERVTKLFSFAI